MSDWEIRAAVGIALMLLFYIGLRVEQIASLLRKRYDIFSD